MLHRHFKSIKQYEDFLLSFCYNKLSQYQKNMFRVFFVDMNVHFTQYYKFNDWSAGTPAMSARNDLKENKPPGKAAKAGILITTAASVAAATLAFAKHQGRPVWNIKINGPQVLGISAASVAGGLGAGIVFDDKIYAKAKAREAFVQYFGNMIVTLACVTAGAKISDKLKLKGIVRGVSVAGGLTTGIFAGNRICNVINEKFFDQKVNRNIQPSDFAPHVDDTALALKYMAGKETVFSKLMTKIIPIALITPGFEVGTCRKVY
jgi:hypothetical protein